MENQAHSNHRWGAARGCRVNCYSASLSLGTPAFSGVKDTEEMLLCFNVQEGKEFCRHLTTLFSIVSPAVRAWVSKSPGFGQ